MESENTFSGEELYEIAIKAQADKKAQTQEIVDEILKSLQPLVYNAIVRSAKNGYTDWTETVYQENYGQIKSYDNDTKFLLETTLMNYNKKTYNIPITIYKIESLPCNKNHDQANPPSWILACKFAFTLPKGASSPLKPGDLPAKGASAPLNPSCPSSP